MRKSARGYEYGVWRWVTPVPEIHKQFLECVVYLYPSRVAAKEGQDFGGTGFLIGYPSEVENYHFYAVTNAHVIDEGSPVIRLNTHDGKSDVLEYACDDWITHPGGDDLAVCPIKPPLDAYKNIALNWNLVVVSEEFMRNKHASYVGAEVFMVGRFVNHEGKQKNTPAVRFGNIAMMPEEPIKGYKGHEQECFLVEMRSHGGFSGSPAFLALPERTYSVQPDPGIMPSDWVYTPQAPIPYSHIKLLGVDCSHISLREPVMMPNPKVGEEDKEHPEGWYVKTNTSMAAVIPTWRLEDLLESHEDLKMQRKIEDERRLEKKQRRERRGSFEFVTRKAPGNRGLFA
jgi:hypothetical protein